MRFRVATLNLEQDHKRWELRRGLVVEQLAAVRPDVLALNEVCMPLRTAHWIRDAARERSGLEYYLVQQTRANGLSIDYIWVSDALRVAESRVCFNEPSVSDPALWPSDHAGVWADLEL